MRRIKIIVLSTLLVLVTMNVNAQKIHAISPMVDEVDSKNIQDVDLEKLADLLNSNVETIENSLKLNFEKNVKNDFNWNIDIKEIDNQISSLGEGKRQELLNEMNAISTKVSQDLGLTENLLSSKVNVSFTMNLKQNIEYKYAQFKGDLTGAMDSIEGWKESKEGEINKQILYVKKIAEDNIKSYILEKAPFDAFSFLKTKKQPC